MSDFYAAKGMRVENRVEKRKYVFCKNGDIWDGISGFRMYVCTIVAFRVSEIQRATWRARQMVTVVSLGLRDYAVDCIMSN